MGPTATYTFTDMNGCTNSADAIVTVNALQLQQQILKVFCIVVQFYLQAPQQMGFIVIM
jgi:hypothetical protein